MDSRFGIYWFRFGLPRCTKPIPSKYHEDSQTVELPYTDGMLIDIDCMSGEDELGRPKGSERDDEASSVTAASGCDSFFRNFFPCSLCFFCDSRCVILGLFLKGRTKKIITSNIKEITKMKMLNEIELEIVAGGHISIVSPGEGTTIEDKETEPRDRSGGATGGW